VPSAIPEPTTNRAAAVTIGIDVRTFQPRSGQDRYLWRLGAWLAGQGHRVELLSVRPQPELAPPPGVRLHRLHGLSRRARRAYLALLELDALLVNPERARHFRGIHANVLRPGYGTDHYRQKLRSFRSPVVLRARQLLRLAPWVQAERRWERRFYEAGEPPPRVIANSRYMRDEVLATYAVPPAHVHVVHNGVDLTEFSPGERARLRPELRARWGIPGDAVCLLVVGHNFRLKGLWELIGLLPELRAAGSGQDVRVLVAGSGVGPRQVRWARRLMARHGVAHAVHLLGAVHPVLHAYAAADALVHLTWHDSFGFVVLEAMATGLPVVTTRFAGAAEAVDDGVSGLLADPGDPSHVLDRLRLLLQPALRRHMGEAAAAAAAAYPEERSFAAVADVVLRAAAEARGPVR
jgi:UDP-glucose:(heptosyl)LPS alpha-1,3-glucosyltransferase